MPACDIPVFGRRFLDGEVDFSQVGGGELGGKGSGLARIRFEILERYGREVCPEVEVSVPRLVVLGTGLFDEFMEHNRLWDLALAEESDVRVALAFQRAEVPPLFAGDLRALLQKVHQPLAIRSSSLLEDALQHPLAGVYATKMIPNLNPLLDRRHTLLLEAVKLVWASTFFQGAKSYLRTIGKSPRDEKMAVVVQEVVGRRFRDRFYPAVSGVARSYNYYPTGHGRPEDGVVNLALGLGKTIVDGGLSWSYAPAFPAAPPPFNDVRAIMASTQTRFWAVNMGPPPPPDPAQEAEFLVEAGLEEAESDGVLRHLVSTYDAGSDRLYPGLAPSGPRILDFSPLLQLRVLGLNDAVRGLLQASEEVLGGPVEIEFALDLDPVDAGRARLGFLQVRPMHVSTEVVEVGEQELDDPGCLVASTHVMGNGVREDLCDVVYVKPEAFEARLTPQVAAELGPINRALVEEGRPYLLFGFGRWGSSDPWLGIPVEWSSISGAKVIVEATTAQMNPELSQGSHFFHNLISFQVLYLAVPHLGGRPIDWGWLDSRPAQLETALVRHVRLPAPLVVRVDGCRSRGLVRKHGAIEG
jgi:hypothetical protein